MVTLDVCWWNQRLGRKRFSNEELAALLLDETERETRLSLLSTRISTWLVELLDSSHHSKGPPAMAPSCSYSE